MAFNNDFVDQLKTRINIVDVIGRDVDLKKSGSGYKGLCPFHNEKTPSFSVNERDQYFHCFGCHAKGDVISYVMQRQGLTFMEAVEKLADEYGMKMPEHSGRKEDFKKYYDINKTAARYFFKMLTSRPNRGLAYLRQRQVKDGTIAKFGLGYCDSSFDGLYNHLKSKGIKDEDMIKLGLVKQGKNGPYDKYRSRVIFPIFDPSGRIIGFGGRRIDDNDRGPKYLNSSESEIFLKKNNLFGLNITKGDIAKADQVLIVEGYMDMISLWQNGITNVAASLGTALTENQVRLITSYTKNVILSYDSDEAGIKAALRGIGVFDGSGANVRVLQVKDGKDPDEYVKKYEQFDDMIWMSGETEIGFETFCRALAKKAGISPRQAKEYVVSNLHNLEHEEAVDALLLALQIIKSENGLEGTQWNKPTCDFLKKEFEKMLGLNDGQENA